LKHGFRQPAFWQYQCSSNTCGGLPSTLTPIQIRNLHFCYSSK
jgi:hypothetical protein